MVQPDMSNKCVFRDHSISVPAAFVSIPALRRNRGRVISHS